MTVVGHGCLERDPLLYCKHNGKDRTEKIGPEINRLKSAHARIGIMNIYQKFQVQIVNKDHFFQTCVLSLVLTTEI